MSPPADVRPSPLAGRWYPADPRELAAAVDRYLGAARPPAAAGAVVALVVPHAGHRYSGPVAGYAFGTARQLTPGLVAIVGPMHHPSDGALLTSGHRAYATPLGEVPIDADVVRGLDVHVRDELGRGLIPVRNDPEHSLEIELPFLQRALPEAFRLVPVIDRKSTRLNSSHGYISYAVFCLKKKTRPPQCGCGSAMVSVFSGTVMKLCSVARPSAGESYSHMMSPQCPIAPVRM